MAESLRTQQLKGIAQKLPVANQQVAQGLKSAQDIQLKSQIGQAKGPISSAGQQALGAQQTAQRGAADLQAGAQTAQQLGQVAGMGLQQRGLEQQQQLGQEERQVSQKQRELEGRLSSLSNDLKDQLIDSQLAFKKDERGRLLLNDRQLLDIAALNATNEEEFRNYQQSIQQVSDRKIAMMEQAYKLISQELTNNLAKSEAGANQEQTLRLTRQKQAMQKKIEKERADQANKAAIGTGIGTVAGAVLGGPAGAMVGGSIGGMVGGMF